MIHQPVDVVSQCSLMPGWSEISADLREAVAQRRVHDDALYKWPRLLCMCMLLHIIVKYFFCKISY